jgi:D-serine deaminase-like pyridoxal phosphate-dependent protein
MWRKAAATMASIGGRISRAIKPWKSPSGSWRQGAIGITCAKLGEAEILAAAGIRDILIANQIVGDLKVARLTPLLDTADVIVSVDSRENVAALAKAAQGKRLRVVMEVNTGMNRAGWNPVNRRWRWRRRLPNMRVCTWSV